MLEVPTKAWAGHYAIILQDVNFQKLVLPHKDTGKSLYTGLYP